MTPLTDTEIDWIAEEFGERMPNTVGRLIADLEAARAALEFYATEWRGNAEGDSTEPGLLRTWMEPTDALWTDAGDKARAALAAAPTSEYARGQRDGLEAAARLIEFENPDDFTWQRPRAALAAAIRALAPPFPPAQRSRHDEQ